jgi:hypothetical protein
MLLNAGVKNVVSKQRETAIAYFIIDDSNRFVQGKLSFLPAKTILSRPYNDHFKEKGKLMFVIYKK